MTHSDVIIEKLLHHQSSYTIDTIRYGCETRLNVLFLNIEYDVSDLKA